MDLRERSNTNKRHPWELARIEVVRKLANTQITSYSNKKILDLGCGDLFFLNEFSKDKPNSELYAVDTGFDDGFLQSQKDGRIHAYKTLDDLPLDDSITFDIILLLDVVEHIEDDFGFLKDLLSRPFVNNQTLFIITVPAYQKLFCSHDHFLGHYRRYDNSSLTELMHKAGLKIETRGYFFLSLLFPRWLEVFKEKKYGTPKYIRGTGLTAWNGNRLLTLLLKNVLISDYRLHSFLKRFNINTPGLSNYTLCRKLV